MINIFYPESHDHLGLLDDLSGIQDVNLLPIKRKHLRSRILKKIRKIHLSSTLNRYIHIPYKNVWFNCSPVQMTDKKNTVVIFDGALKHFTTKQLDQWVVDENTTCILILINSLRASSAVISDIKDIIPKVKWDHILTFDPIDARDFGYEYLGCCYYSMHSIEDIRKDYPGNKETDICFTGGIKGGRWNYILSIFEYLKDHVRTDFNINVTGKAKYSRLPYDSLINYNMHEWVPYKKVLSDVLDSNVILEVLQNGQHGPSLRYYEAVCYNKKLITNNYKAEELPFYNSNYIKIITNPEDIDLAWVKAHDKVEYNYHNEFSPISLIERIRKFENED